MIDPGQLANLRDSQVLAMVNSPMDHMTQMSILAELGKRLKGEQAQSPTSTVLDDLKARAATTQQNVQPAAPNDNILSGAQEIVAQQQQVPRMADGGRFELGPLGYAEYHPGSDQPSRRTRASVGGGGDYLSYLQRNYPKLREMFGSNVDELYATTPEEAKATAAEFAPQDRLSPFADELTNERGQIDADRKRALWLAVAQGGFNMLGRPTLAAGLRDGGIALTSGVSAADAARAAALRDNSGRRLSIAQAQSAGDRATSDRAAGLYTQGIAARAGADESAMRGTLQLLGESRQDARSAASLRAEENKLMNQYKQLLEMGYTEEEAREQISAAVGGRSGNAANNTDDYIRLYQQILKERNGAQKYDEENGEGAFDQLRQLAGIPLGGGERAPSNTRNPTPDRDPSVTTRRDGQQKAVVRPANGSVPSISNGISVRNTELPPPKVGRHLDGYSVEPR